MHTLTRKRPSPYRQRDDMALANAVLLGALDALLMATAGGQSVPYRQWVAARRGRDEGERRTAQAMGCEVKELGRG